MTGRRLRKTANIITVQHIINTENKSPNMLPNVPEEHFNEISAQKLTSLIINQRKKLKKREQNLQAVSRSAKAN